MSVVNALLRNDPNVSSITIRLRSETSDADLARALEQNPFITEVYLYLHGAERGNPRRLLQQVLPARANLTTLTLHNGPPGPFPHTGEAAAASAFLEAAHANAAVEEIRFYGFRFVPRSDFFNWLCSTEFGEKLLVIFRCDMVDPTQREHGARALAASNIKRLQIEHRNNAFTSALLQNLAPNSSLEELVLIVYTSFDEIERLLPDTKSFQRFHLHGPSRPEIMRQRLLQEIKSNFSLRSLTVQYEDMPLFGQATEQRRLAFYLNRNERLEEWVEKPDVLGREFWPEALSLAQRAGPDALYKSLQSVLGKDYVKVESSSCGKKRKHA